jgi:putative transport protein
MNGVAFFNVPAGDQRRIAASAPADATTPGLNAVLDKSESQVAAVPFPVAYAVTTVLALIGGYIAQLLS